MQLFFALHLCERFAADCDSLDVHGAAKCRCGAGVDAEIANGMAGLVRLRANPVACQFEPVGEQVDVKAIALARILNRRQQIK